MVTLMARAPSLVIPSSVACPAEGPASTVHKKEGADPKARPLQIMQLQ